ncbi:zinc c2h2 finger domain containing protein [Ophiostoma piceae UAMH 11346]|uniref:Zinc c2h2 finger domain containing protein n=1 Tax=Ophiostoma piceae (strain UAMH 11346) TaxID=1262450 RepID=S3CSS5_OPHP1|nr:zinc c2h2 finger domain containing protein [Ophiostoma piceae UAMH 11346]
MAQRSDEYNSLYPEPPHGTFHSPALSSNANPVNQSINQHMSPFYQQRMSHDFYAHAATTTAATTPVPSSASAFDILDGLYTETSLTAMLGDQMSPTMFHEDPDMRTSSLSTGSGPSAPSSAVGSPRSHHSIPPTAAPEWPAGANMSVSPNIVQQGDFFVSGEYSLSSGYHNDEFTHFEFPQPKSFVADPSILHSEVRPMGIPTFDSFTHPPPALHHQHPHQSHPHQHQHQHQSHAPAVTSYATSPAHSPLIKTDAHSPYPTSAGPYVAQFSPFLASTPMGGAGSGSSGSVVSVGPDQVSRGGSRGSFSGFSASAEQQFSDGEGKEKQKCPYPECGRRYKDIRAHMLTHMNERPEKCPIQTCEYHTKGFARKYDKNRHTLTHYKGTMVCGFCPGSGSSAEKSFNRADVFKRHLTAVHGVEQSPPNSRKKASGSGAGTPGSAGGVQKLTTYAPDATGKCSTCSQTFTNAQEFYEHLDDCVLRIVQLEDPAEAVNASRLAEVENDFDVKVTLEKNQLPATEGTPTSSAAPAGDDEDDEEMEFDEYAVGDDESPHGSALSGHGGSPSKRHSKLNPANGVQKSRGMTHSRGGVPFTGKTRSRRSRQNYPTSWGFDKGQMTMRKRVMTVFEGPRRLAKDDMMLSTEHEVRLKLSDGKAYVTDLDVQTMKRAEGFLTATDEEKGVWVSDDPTDAQIKQMQNGNI